MKMIFNFLLTLVVFYVGSRYFPEHLYIEDTETLILTSVLRFVLAWILAWTFAISVLLIPLGVGCITSIPLFIAILFSTPLILWVIDHYVHSFAVNGFWTYVVLTAIFGIFSLTVSTSSETTTDKK